MCIHISSNIQREIYLSLYTHIRKEMLIYNTLISTDALTHNDTETLTHNDICTNTHKQKHEQTQIHTNKSHTHTH